MTRNLTLVLGPSLVAWYLPRARALPWRTTRDPYRIWVSEIILQQTRVAQGLGYYERFLARFPSLEALASAPLDAVLKAWEGLGYYTRARNLHATAQHILHTLGGQWPTTTTGLEALKGIGPYTARALASICFGERVAVLDGNVFRVLSRLYADPVPINSPSARVHYQPLADGLLESPGLVPAELNQALMELGATLCTPRTPGCTTCPWQPHCAAFASGAPTRYPVKQPKPERGNRYYEYYLVVGPQGTVRLRQRDASSYWKGLWELPAEEVPTWRPNPPQGRERFRLTHEFSHFRLHIRVNEVPEQTWVASPDERTVGPNDLEGYALSRAVQKVLAQHWADTRTLF